MWTDSPHSPQLFSSDHLNYIATIEFLSDYNLHHQNNLPYRIAIEPSPTPTPNSPPKLNQSRPKIASIQINKLK